MGAHGIHQPRISDIAPPDTPRRNRATRQMHPAGHFGLGRARLEPSEALPPSSGRQPSTPNLLCLVCIVNTTLAQQTDPTILQPTSASKREIS